MSHSTEISSFGGIGHKITKLKLPPKIYVGGVGMEELHLHMCLGCAQLFQASGMALKPELTWS